MGYGKISKWNREFKKCRLHFRKYGIVELGVAFGCDMLRAGLKPGE